MTADEEYMTLCIELAKKAAEKGECPVGAIVVDKDGRIIGEGYNCVKLSRCRPLMRK